MDISRLAVFNYCTIEYLDLSSIPGYLYRAALSAGDVLNHVLSQRLPKSKYTQSTMSLEESFDYLPFCLLALPS